MNRNEKRNFEVGYKQAMAGKPANEKLYDYRGYADGYDAGSCDRPSMEEAIGIDIRKEQNSPLGGF